MEFQNKLEIHSESMHLYLKFLGYTNEFEIAQILLDFKSQFQLNQHPTLTIWEQWIEYLNQKNALKEYPIPLKGKDWQFGSMVPMPSYQSQFKSKSKFFLQELRPVFILFMILFWSAIYYLILFKLL